VAADECLHQILFVSSLVRSTNGD